MTSGGNNFSNIPENKMTKFCALASCYCLLPLPSRSHKHPHKHPLITPFELQMVGVSHENVGAITPWGGLDKPLLTTVIVYHELLSFFCNFSLEFVTF